MAQSYKPGETVPQDGKVQCSAHPEIEDNVKAGTKFAPCHHFGDKESGAGCTWQYV